MTGKIRTAVVLALASTLGACGVGPGITGNSTGGIIPWSPANQAYARDYAAEHCGYYGKVAELKPIYARDGEYITFRCNFPTDGPSFRYSR
jgi:hypothetical protein